MKKELIMIVLLAILPSVAIAQQEVSYLDSADLCRQREDWKGMEGWLKKGAKAGQKECMNELGDYYCEQEDYKKGAKYYAMSADPRGDYELGYLYLSGLLSKHGDSDTEHGLPLIRRSERANYRDAIYMTARMFDAGIALSQNYDSAVYMLRRLPTDGQALFMLARYYEAGTGVDQDSLQAMEFFRRAGEADFGDGYSFLGDYYRNGFAGIKPDSLQAFQTYMLAAGATTAYANGMTDIAECYLEGIGTRIDSAKAIYYLRDAVEAGSYKAASMLADMYNYGRGGIQPNGDTALMLYQMASQGDDPRGDYMMGAYLYHRGAYDNAMGYLQSAMMNGSVDAALLVAQALLTGNGAEQNPIAAVSLLEQLVDDDPTGQAHFLLGLAHYTGSGVPVNYEQSLLQLDTAASLGNARAMLTLGQLYNGSNGIERDTVLVRYWYERAAAAGSVDAMVQLAGSYLSGTAVPRDQARAIELYQQAADLGSLDALCYLGLCHEQGDGVPANPRRAYNLYLQAAEQGSPYGMRLVGLCYSQGIYVEQDLKQAADWFTRSAEAGDIRSAYILGQLYAAGEGVKKDKKAARRWLSIAAENGLPGAAEALEQL